MSDSSSFTDFKPGQIFTSWWDLASEQLNAIQDQSFRELHEKFFISINVMGLNVPNLQVDGDEVWYDWNNSFKLQVRHDGDTNSALFSLYALDEDGNLVPQDDLQDLDFPKYPMTVNVLKQIFDRDIAADVIQDLDETFPTRVAEPVDQELGETLDGLLSMTRELVDFARKVKAEDSSHQEVVVELQSLGQFLQWVFVQVILFLRWLISRVGGRIPLYHMVKGMTEQAFELAQDGSMNGTFDYPDSLLRNTPSIHRPVNFMFKSLLKYMEYHRVTVPLTAFLLGLYF